MDNNWIVAGCAGALLGFHHKAGHCCRIIIFARAAKNTYQISINILVDPGLPGV